MKNCNLKKRRIKVSGLYEVPASGKRCPRQFPKIEGLSKTNANTAINARKRLIKKALKINEKHWGKSRWE